MKQVFSRRGEVAVEEVPSPLCGVGGVLVRTAWSLLSAGTERTNISGQRVVDRLRRQPAVVGKVWHAEIEAFLRAVRGEAPLAVTVMDGVRATVVALRAIEAAATATTLAVDSARSLNEEPQHA